MRNCFHAGDILIPQKISMKKWACVACDQFSSQREYWNGVEEFVGEAPSTYHMIFPEALLRTEDKATRLSSIHRHMEAYLNQGIFRNFRRSFVYLERQMENGLFRRGLMGYIDLEEYDFTPGTSAHIRATEGTVLDRIPPRMELLRGAALEFPHVLLLCDDKKDEILSTAREVAGETVYDFDLMEDGGRIRGKVISGLGVSVVNAAISRYIGATEAHQGKGNTMSFAVGDGNHSLASAKACWEEMKPALSQEAREEHPARFALVELENIHDPAIDFEPIHRVIQTQNREQLELLLDTLKAYDAPQGHSIVLCHGDAQCTIHISKENTPLALSVLQPLLDDFVAKNGGTMDYIHGEEVVRQLATRENTLGILLPGIDKGALFLGVLRDGVLPRKTFSMGHAREKRYYLEGKMRR